MPSTQLPIGTLFVTPCRIAILRPVRMGPWPETYSFKLLSVTSGCVTISFVFLMPALRIFRRDSLNQTCFLSSYQVIYWLPYSYHLISQTRKGKLVNRRPPFFPQQQMRSTVPVPRTRSTTIGSIA
jgi:hypothetical protein